CRGARDSSATGAGAGLAVFAFLVSLAVGSHWLASDVALLFFLLASVVAQPIGQAGASRETPWLRNVRFAAASLLAAGSLVAALETAGPAEPFPRSSRIGFHGEELGARGPFRRTRPRL